MSRSMFSPQVPLWWETGRLPSGRETCLGLRWSVSAAPGGNGGLGPSRPVPPRPLAELRGAQLLGEAAAEPFTRIGSVLLPFLFPWAPGNEGDVAQLSSGFP